jgi:hypothetical protein
MTVQLTIDFAGGYLFPPEEKPYRIYRGVAPCRRGEVV